jgi:hypothetical protein
MLERLGSLAVVSHTERRLELQITAATTWTGWSLAGLASALCAVVWPLSHLLTALPMALAVLGGLLATTRRRLVFDRDDGLLRVEQRIAGLRSRVAVPLFHLRAVVVAAERGHWVAHLERRAGGRIRVDDARQRAPLLAMARAICDVTQLRLVCDEHDPTSSAG